MQTNRKQALRNAFATRLRELRKANNHTQDYLAQKLHISKSSISNWEAGLRMPDMQTLQAIAQLYSVSLEYLFGDSKRPMHYVPEDKFIDKERYLDLHQLCEADQYALKSYYEHLLTKNRG